MCIIATLKSKSYTPSKSLFLGNTNYYGALTVGDLFWLLLFVYLQWGLSNLQFRLLVLSLGREALSLLLTGYLKLFFLLKK